LGTRPRRIGDDFQRRLTSAFNADFAEQPGRVDFAGRRIVPGLDNDRVNSWTQRRSNIKHTGIVPSIALPYLLTINEELESVIGGKNGYGRSDPCISGQINVAAKKRIPGGALRVASTPASSAHIHEAPVRSTDGNVAVPIHWACQEFAGDCASAGVPTSSATMPIMSQPSVKFFIIGFHHNYRIDTKW
jgi:hypothetical protein